VAIKKSVASDKWRVTSKYEQSLFFGFLVPFWEDRGWGDGRGLIVTASDSEVRIVI